MNSPSEKPAGSAVAEIEARLAAAADRSERHDATIALMHHLLYTDSERVLQLGEGIREETASGEDRKLYGRLLEYLGIASAHRHTYDKAHKYFCEARSIFEELDDRLQIMLMTTNLGNVETYRGNHDQALEHYTTSLQMSEELKNVRHRITVLGNLGYLSLHRDDFVRAEAYLAEGIELAGKIDHRLGKANLLHNLGLLRYERGKWREGLSDLYQSLELFEDLGQRLQETGVVGDIASVMIDAGDFEAALNWYRRALETSQEIGDIRGTALVLNNLGSLHCNLRRHQEARDYLEESLKLKESLGNPYEIASTLINLGDVCADLDRNDEAAAYYRRCIDICTAGEDRRNLGLALLGTARLHRREGEIDFALASLNKALEMFRQIGLPKETVLLLTEQGELLLETDRDQALRRLNEAMETAGEYDLRREQIRIHAALSRAYEGLRKYARALAHHKEFERLRSEIGNEESERRYLRLSVIHEVERQKRSRQLAEKQAEILRLEKERLQSEGEHRQKELTTTAMFLTQKNDLLEKLRRKLKDLGREGPGRMKSQVASLLCEIDGAIDTGRSWETFEQQFRHVHGDYLERLAARHPNLSPTELKVCALLKIGLTTKETARILNIEPRSVETYRGRIRKKIGMSVGGSLQAYLIRGDERHEG